MPPVVAAIGAIVSAIGTAASAIAATFGVTGGIGAFLGKLALNFAISALVGKLFSKKPSAGGYAAEAQGRQVVVRSAIQARNIVYGTAVTSGPLVFAHSTGTSNEYLHLVIALAGHEVEAIDSVFFNDEEIAPGQIDGSGDVVAGRFAGHARIRKYLGTSTQTADADLMSAAPGLWTPNHRLQGVAYLYVRLKHNYDVYAGGLPNIKAAVRGKKLYDPRDGATRWTDNPALAVRDYLVSAYGLGALAGEIDDTVCAAAANLCDERVAVVGSGAAATFDAAADTVTIDPTQLRFGTHDGVRFTSSGTLPAPLAPATTYYLVRLSATTCKLATSAANARARVYIDLTTAGSGTHQMVHHDQPRYTVNGILSTEAGIKDNVQALLTAMAGALPWVQGKYEIRAGAYVAPTLALDEDDLRGALSVQAKTPRRELFNAVKGVYVEPWKFWQPTDFPPMTNATYETQDGGVRIERDIDLALTTNQIMAQRIAKIHLEKSRQGITVTFPAKLVALRTKAWATVTLTIAHLGWSAKVFRVMSWTLSPDGGVDLTLQEESSASYDWASGEASVYDAAPDTTLPSAVSVAAPSGLVLDSGSDQAFVNADGTIIVRAYAQWTAPTDAFVTALDFQWKRAADSAWQSRTLAPAVTSAYIEPAIEGTTYDVRVRAINAYGAASAFVSGSIAVTGKDTPPGDPSALASQSAPEAVKLTWTNPVDPDLDRVEVWEASTNDRSGAAKIAEVAGDFFTRTGLAASAVRYYWIRAVDTTGNVSGYHPTGATAGVAGTAGASGGAVDYADVTGTKPPADADKTASAINAGATVTSGGITFSAGGAIKGGATDYLTGTGWFLGYSGGQYKFSIGSPTGAYLGWDGTNLTMTGVVRNGMTAYASGTGYWLGLDGATPKFSIGNASNFLRWDGGTLSVGGAIIATGNIQSAAATQVVTSNVDTAQSLTLSSWVTVSQATITTSGNPVELIFSASLYLGSTTTAYYGIKVLRGATLVYLSGTADPPALGNGIAYTGSTELNKSFIDTPTAGTHTYYVQLYHINPASPVGSAAYRKLSLLEIKR